jgi:hypothetical protein
MQKTRCKNDCRRAAGLTLSSGVISRFPIPNPYNIPEMKLPFLTLMVCSLASMSQAATIQFNLIGTAGPGLLPGNEPAVASGGTGGEIGTGITFDDVSNLLTINVGWGSSQGFADLSSAANNSHIHVTASNNGFNGVSNFTQTGGVVFTLTRSSNAVSGGMITNAPILLNAAQKADLLNGKYYINIHTVNNGGGEMRGFLVVPEPGSALLGMVALGAFSLRRRRA